jgi:hypothetical protein
MGGSRLKWEGTIIVRHLKYSLACFRLILVLKEFVTILVHDAQFGNYMRGLAFCHEWVFKLTLDVFFPFPSPLAQF